MDTCKNINTISDEICTYICNKYYPNSESSETQEHNTCKTNCDTEIKKELNPFTLKDRLFGYHLDKMGVTETQNSYQEVGDLIATDRDTLDQLIADMTYQESLNDKYCEIQTGIKWKAYNLSNDAQKAELLSTFRKYSSFGLKWEKKQISDIASLPVLNLPEYENFNTLFANKINTALPDTITFTLSELYSDDVYENILPNSYIEYTVADAGADADAGAEEKIYYKVKAYDLDIFNNQSTKNKFISVNVSSGTAIVTLTNNDIADSITGGFEYSDFILDSNIVYIPIIGCNEYSGYSCDTIKTTLEDNCYIPYDSASHVLREENISNMLENSQCIDSILKMHNTNNLYTKINQIFNDSYINTYLGNMMGLNKAINDADVTSINSKIDEIIEGMDDDFFSIDDFIKLSSLNLQYWKIESESIATTYYDELTITPTDTELTKLHYALQEKLTTDSSIDDLITLEKNQFSDSGEWQSLIINNNQGISNANYIIVDSTYLIPYIPLHDFYYKRGYDVFSKCLKYENVPDEVNTIEIKNYDDAVLGRFKKIGSDVDTYNALIDADDLIEKSQCDTEKTELIEKETNQYLYTYINNVNNCRVVDSEIAPLDGEKSSYDSYKSKLENYDNGALKNIINSDFSKLNEYSTLEAKFNNGAINNKFYNYYKHIDDRGGDCKYTDEYYYSDNSCVQENYGECSYIVDDGGVLPQDTSNRNSPIKLVDLTLTENNYNDIVVNRSILTKLGSEKLGELEHNIEEYKKDTYSNKKTTIVNASQWNKYSDLKQAPDFVYSTELLSENIDDADIDDIINDASIIDSLTDADYNTLKTGLINELKAKLQSASLVQADSTLINVLSDTEIILSNNGVEIATPLFDNVIQILFENNRLDKDVYIKDDTSNYYFLNLNFTQCDVSNVQYSECPSSESCQYVDDYTNSIEKITGGDTEECADYLKYTRDCENYKTAKNIINKRINYDTCIDYFKNGFSLPNGKQYKISYEGSPANLIIRPTPSGTDGDTSDDVIAKFREDVYQDCSLTNDMPNNIYINYNANDYTCQTVGGENILTCPHNSEVNPVINRVGMDKCIASVGYYKNTDAEEVTYEQCPDGKTTNSIGMTLESECTMLKAGYSYDSTSGSINECNQGTYREGDIPYTQGKSEACLSCNDYEEGTTTTGTGADNRDLCNTASKGYYKDGDGYLECPSGKTTSGVGMTLESQCTMLKEGYSYDSTSGEATKCEPGTYREGEVLADQDRTCLGCPAGKTTDGDGKISVSNCDKLVKGYYESVSGDYTACPVGLTTELNSDKTGFARECTTNDASCCDMVAAGYSYDSTGTTATTACLVGTYRENDVQIDGTDKTCTPCSTVGSTTDGDGMTSEDDCNIARKGYYKDGNSYQACPLGSTTYDARMTSDSQCDYVKAGYYIDSDGSYRECAKGKYSEDRPTSDITASSQCLSCPPGLTTNSSGANSESLCNIADISTITNFISSSSDAGGSGGSGGSGGGGADSGADSGGGGIIQSGNSDFTTLQSVLESQISGDIPDKGIITISNTDSGVTTDEQYIYIASDGAVIAFIPVDKLKDGYEYDDTANGEIFKCSNGYYKDQNNVCIECDHRDKCIDGVKITPQNGGYYCSFNQYFDYTDAVMDCKTDNQACKQEGAITEKYHIQMGKECKLTNLSGDTNNPKCPDGTKLIITGRDNGTGEKDDFYGLCQACGHHQRQDGDDGTACVNCGLHEKYEEKDPQEFDYNGHKIYNCVACEEWEQTSSDKSLCMDLPISYKWKYDSNGIRSQTETLSTNEIKAGHANYGSSDIPTVSYIKGFIITYTSDATSFSPTIDINYTQETGPMELNKQGVGFPSYMPKFQIFLQSTGNTNYIFFEPDTTNLTLDNLNYITYTDAEASIDNIKEIIAVVNKDAYGASTGVDESKFMYYLLTNTVNNVIYAQDDTGEYIGHDEQNDMLTDRQRYAIHHGTSTKYNYIQRDSSGTVKLQQTNTDGTDIEIAVDIQPTEYGHEDMDLNKPYSVGTPPSSELIYHKDYNKKRYTIYKCEPDKGLYRDDTYTCRYIDDGRFTYGQTITTGNRWLSDPSSAGDPDDYKGDYEGLEGFTLMNPGSLPTQTSTQQQTDGDFFTIQEHFTAPSQDLNDNTIKQCGAVFDLTFPETVDVNIKKFKPIVNNFTKIGQQYHEEACHYDCNPGMKYVKDNDNIISNNRCEYCPDDNWSNGEADSDDVTCKQHSNLTFTAGAEIPHILWEGDQYQDRQVAYDAQGNYNLLNATALQYGKAVAQLNKIYNYDGAPDNTRPIKCKGGYYNGYYKNSAWNDYTKVTDIYFVKSKINISDLSANSGDPNYIAGLKELTDKSSSLYTRLKTRTGYLPKLHLAIPSLKDVTVVGNTMQLNQDQQDRYELDLSFTNKDSYTYSNPYSYPTAMKSLYSNSIYYYNNGLDRTWTKVNIDDTSEYIFETLNDGSDTYDVIKYTYYEDSISTEINYIITTEPDTLAILDDNFFNITADAITANDLEDLVREIKSEYTSAKQHFYFSGETNDDDTFYMYTPYFNCIECSAGTAREGSTNDDVTSCPNCPQGEYQNLTGESTCNPCGANRNTTEEGSDKIADCLCDEGYYEDNASSCTMCPIGTYKTEISNDKVYCTDCPVGMGGIQTSSGPSRIVPDSKANGCVDCQNTEIYAGNSAAQSYYEKLAAGEKREEVSGGEPGYICNPCPPGSICTAGVISGCEYGYKYDGTATCAPCEDDEICKGGCATGYQKNQLSMSPSYTFECSETPDALNSAEARDCSANNVDNAMCLAGKITGCLEGYKYNADTYSCQQCDDNELCIGERSCSSQPCDRTPQSPPPCASPNVCSNGIVTKCKKNSYYDTTENICKSCPGNRITGKLAILKEAFADGNIYYISDDDGETWTLKNDSDFNIANYSIVEHTDTLDILNGGATELDVDQKDDLKTKLTIDIRDSNADISKCVAEEGYFVTTADLQRDNVHATQCAVNKNTMGIGKTSARDCLAKAGFELDGTPEEYTTAAVVCPADTYKTDLSNEPCTQCPDNTISKASSHKTSVNDCKAKEGYYIDGTDAIICDAGKYINIDQTGKDRDVDSGQCIDNTFTDSDGSTQFTNHYSHPGLTLEQYNDQFETKEDTDADGIPIMVPDLSKPANLVVPESNKVINPDLNTYQDCPENYINNYGDLTTLPHPSAPPGGFYGLFDCIPKSGYYINSTMTDAESTPLADIEFGRDYNTYTDADYFPTALECTGYIDNDLTNHTYKNPTTNYDNIKDTVTTHTECTYPTCTSGSNTYYRNKDNKCIFDAYVENQISASILNDDSSLPTKVSDFNTANNHNVIDYNIVLFSGSATDDEDAYIIRNNTRNESLDDYLKLPPDRLYTHNNFKGTRHHDDDSLQLYNDYIGDSSHYAERQFNNIMFSHEIPTNNNSISSTDEEKFNIARQNWKATDASGIVIFELKEIYAPGSSPSVNNLYKQYIPEHELFVKTHSISNLKHYIDNANNIYFTKEEMIADEKSEVSVTLPGDKTYTTLAYVPLTPGTTLYRLLIDNKDYYIKSDHDDIHDVKKELKKLIDNSTSQSLVLYFGNYKYKFFIDPVKGNFYQYNDSSGASPPSECTEGSYTMKYGATSSSDCTWAGPGYYIDSGNSDTITACSSIENTYYRDGYTNTYNLPSDKCTQCPNNKVIDNPQYAGDTVYKHNVSGDQCVPSKGYYGGQGVDASDVYACRVGTYKTHAGGGSSNDVCISCPNNKTTESTGSYLEDHCLPEPGYYGPAGSNSDAIRCSGNTYKDNIEATDISACTSCPRNKVIADNIKNGTDGPVSDHCVPDIGFYGPTGSDSDAVHCPIGKGINVSRKTPESVSYQDDMAIVEERESCQDCSDGVSVLNDGNNYYECTDCPVGGSCASGKYEGLTTGGYYSKYEPYLTLNEYDNDLYLYEYLSIPLGGEVIDLSGTDDVLNDYNDLLDLIKKENGLPSHTKINNDNYAKFTSMMTLLDGNYNKPYVKFNKTDTGTDHYYKWYLSPKACPKGYKCTGNRSAVACPIGTYQDATGGHECTTCNSLNKGINTGSGTGAISESDACEVCEDTTLNESVVSNNIYVSGTALGNPNNDYYVIGTYIANTLTGEDAQSPCVDCPYNSICTDGKIVGCLEGFEYEDSSSTCVQCNNTEICVGGCIAGYTYSQKSLPDGTEKYGCIANRTDSSNTAIAKSCSSNNAETCNAGKIVTCKTGNIMTDKNSPNNDQDRGYYYDASERTCKVCPTNTYASTATPINVDNKNQDTVYNCIPNSGYYFKYPNSGIYSIDSSTIVECPYNKFSKTDTRLSGSPIERCDDPPGNNLCSENEFCQTCPAPGKGIKINHEYDGISSVETTNCRPCIDDTGNSGEYRDSDGTCQTCEQGTICSEGSSTGCLAGYYIPETRPSGVSNQYNQCYPCIEDHYCTGGDLDANASPCPTGTTSDGGNSMVSEDLCYLEDGKYFTYTAGTGGTGGSSSAYATAPCPGEGAFAPPSPYKLANFKAFIQDKSGISSYHKTTDCLYNACPDGQHRDFSGSCVQTTTTASPPCTNAKVPISNRYQHGTDISVGPLSWPENTDTGTLYTQSDIQPIYEKYYHDLENADFLPTDAPSGTPAIRNDLRLFGNNYQCVASNEICTATNTYLDPIS